MSTLKERLLSENRESAEQSAARARRINELREGGRQSVVAGLRSAGVLELLNINDMSASEEKNLFVGSGLVALPWWNEEEEVSTNVSVVYQWRTTHADSPSIDFSEYLIKLQSVQHPAITDKLSLPFGTTEEQASKHVARSLLGMAQQIKSRREEQQERSIQQEADRKRVELNRELAERGNALAYGGAAFVKKIARDLVERFVELDQDLHATASAYTNTLWQTPSETLWCVAYDDDESVVVRETPQQIAEQLRESGVAMVTRINEYGGNASAFAIFDAISAHPICVSPYTEDPAPYCRTVTLGQRPYTDLHVINIPPSQADANLVTPTLSESFPVWKDCFFEALGEEVGSDADTLRTAISFSVSLEEALDEDAAALIRYHRDTMHTIGRILAGEDSTSSDT